MGKPSVGRIESCRRAVAGLALAALVIATLSACASGPPPHRTVLFLRNDLNFGEVWSATTGVLAEEFPGGTSDLSRRYVRTGYRYDELGNADIRWYAVANVKQYGRNWGVQVTTVAEKLQWSGWKQIGLDDKTSKWLTRRIDQRILLDKGTPPRDNRFLTEEEVKAEAEERPRESEPREPENREPESSAQDPPRRP